MKSFFAELQRRDVYKVAAGYAVAALLLIPIATQVFSFFEVPNRAIQLVVLAMVIGFPITMVPGDAAKRADRPYAWLLLLSNITCNSRNR
jgi:hypothetical protein